MALKLKERGVKRLAAAYLTASAHLDAFFLAPGAYLIATKWWILGKRVRAHGQFAPLLSKSPKAYSLWAMKQDRVAFDGCSYADQFPITAFVDVKDDASEADLSATAQCLAREGISAFWIGSKETPSVLSAASRVDWNDRPGLMVLSPGDTLLTGAASRYRHWMAKNPGARVIYADDDIVANHRRDKPHFKPDWNEELYGHFDFLSGSCILRPSYEDLDAVSLLPNWVASLTSRLVAASNPLHLPEILHHRRQRPRPKLPVQPVQVQHGLPTVSVIVPTRNRVDLLRTCLDGLGKVTYPDTEVIVMDNNSDEPETMRFLKNLSQSGTKVISHPGHFNYSAINNHGVSAAKGHFICLLNNDIEMLDADWLAVLATQATRKEVGAVGAQLLYPDGRVQHAGVVIGVGNAAGHAHRFLKPDEEGYFFRHRLPQFTTAVTAACLVVQKDKFLAVGGLNEQEFPVAFNDVDLCLKLNERGWQSFYEPRATLIHHESVSRGFDRDPVGAARFASELAALKRLWGTDRRFDPFHHPQLSRASEQFAVAV